MMRESEGTLLRIFAGDEDRHEGRPLDQLVVERARAAGLSGATVLHGPMGFGRHSSVHSAKLAEVASDLPVVIEIVDETAAIQQFVLGIAALLHGRLVTLERVRILRFE